MLVVQLGVNAHEAKVFKARAALLGLCDNLINELELLANQQKKVTAQFKASFQACRKEAEKASWKG